MQDERFVIGYLDHLGERFQALFHVNVGLAGVSKNQNFPVQVEVYAGGLDVQRVQGVYNNPATVHLFPDRPIT
jgi:hypothetical protein